MASDSNIRRYGGQEVKEKGTEEIVPMWPGAGSIPETCDLTAHEMLCLLKRKSYNGPSRTRGPQPGPAPLLKKLYMWRPI